MCCDSDSAFKYSQAFLTNTESKSLLIKRIYIGVSSP